MKNKYLKKVFITCGISVLAGVLVFGASAAFGAPTIAPPGAGISPTFTGLTVTGDSNMQGDILGNYIEATSMDIESLTISSGGSGLSISGVIKNTVSNNDGAVKVDDSFQVTGSISNPAGNVKIDDNFDVTGSISNPTGALNFNDDVNVAGEIGSIYSDYILRNVSQIQPPTNSNFSILGSGTYAPYIGVNSTTGKISIGGLGSVEIDNNGKIKAEQFGKYRDYNSGLYITPNSTVSVSNTCPAGEYIVSCGYEIYTSSTFTSDDITIEKVYSSPSANACFVVAKNSGPSTSKYVRARSVCQDPNAL